MVKFTAEIIAPKSEVDRIRNGIHNMNRQELKKQLIECSNRVSMTEAVISGDARLSTEQGIGVDIGDILKALLNR